MKFYILCSRDLFCLERQFDTIPKDQTVVVLNSLDESFVVSAVSFCEKEQIEYYVTTSDGTPATGKNEALRLFLESDNEYSVHVDGDDMLTDYGVSLYNEVAKRKNVPDCIALYRQAARDLSVSKDLVYPFDKSAPDQQALASNLKEVTWYYTEWWKYYHGDSANIENGKRLADLRFELNTMIAKYMESHESMCRLIFFSRKCAEMMWYDPILTIGEDTIQFLKLKKIALSGGLNMVRHRERGNPSYIYMLDTEGTVKVTCWEWMTKFIPEVNKLSLFEPYQNLPELLNNEVNR